jgi:hypothetical protein
MDVDIFIFDEIEVMQADSFERRSAELYWLEIRDRCNDSRSSHLEIH